MATKISSPRKRVICIGAGPCGLPVIKEMLAGGHDAICFEKSPGLGGVFADTHMYNSLHLTLSNWCMAYSDFPNKDLQCYPSGAEYLRYLKDYADHFDLNKHIVYNAEVVSATQDMNEKWTVEIRENGKMRVEHADAVIVATGAHQIPRGLPAPVAAYEGRTVHSSNYNEAFRQEIKEKQLRVMLIGGGESAADIGADLGSLTPHTTVWLRRPNGYAPRFLTPKTEVEQLASSKKERLPVTTFLESTSTNRMSAGQNVFFYGYWRRMLWSIPLVNRALARSCLDATTKSWVMADQALYVTKNQRMCEAWDDGKIEVLTTPNVSAHGKMVKFRMPDGRTETREFDAIVLCSGYDTVYPWLKIENFDTNPRSWYLHTFPAGFQNSLFFSGYARPHQGGIPPMAEMQSRYISLILNGERSLPKDYVERAKRDAATEREYYSITPDLDALVDYNSFIESVARRVGCEARLPALSVVSFNAHLFALGSLLLRAFAPEFSPLSFNNAALLWIGTLLSFFFLYDGLLIKWWFYPNWPIWYRQRGPDANPQLFHAVMDRTNIWRDIEINRGFLFFASWGWFTYQIQRLVSVFVFIPHTVTKALGIRYPKAWGAFLVPKLYALHDNEWRFEDLFLP